MAYQIQLRRDTSTNWQTNDPILAEGEIGIELDTNYFKIGNGIDNWNNLVYYGDDFALKTDTGMIFQFGRNGNTARGDFYRLINGLKMSNNIGYLVPANGKLVAMGYVRSDNDDAVFQVLKNGTVIYELNSSDYTGFSNNINQNVASGDVISVKNKGGWWGVNTTTNVEGWLMFRWRIA